MSLARRARAGAGLAHGDGNAVTLPRRRIQFSYLATRWGLGVRP
jgi:hypothetical protein